MSAQVLPSSTCSVQAKVVGALSDEALLRVDPMEMNLSVARGVSNLAALDIAPYKACVDEWADDIRARLPKAERNFHRCPSHWKNDLAFFRLGVLCWYVDEVLGIRYREDQRDLAVVAYTNPSDLFLNGVIDTRRGTCANMPTLHVALGWRLGWPLSLACAGWHLFCRYEQNGRIHNIEATNNGRGGFHSHPDTYYQQKYDVPEHAIRCGGDLTALTPRQTLGLCFGLRARHCQDIGLLADSARDYRLAAMLFPNSLLLRRKALALQPWLGKAGFPT
jgi:hypothetical protein